VCFEGLDNVMMVRLDKQRFQQIFLNFLSNAAKFVRGPGLIRVVLSKIKKHQENSCGITEAVNDFFKNSNFEENSSDSEEGIENKIKSKLVWTESEKSQFREARREEVSRLLESEDQDKLVLAVMDSGVGIKTADQTKLFK